MSAPLLTVEKLEVVFGGARRVVAVAGCSFHVARGEVLALVGESGSGKSTIARAVAGIVAPTAGMIALDGQDILSAKGRAARRRVQMIFQDPEASLNPYHSVGATLAEPLALRGIARAEWPARVAALLEMVGLDADFAARRPRQLSGGQKQRVAIARALAMEPTLLIADEALAALDVSTQRVIADLLADLRARLGLAILFISHDLLMVRHLADRIAVLRDGRIVESGPCGLVLDSPVDAHTAALLAATPDLARGGLDLDHVAEDQA